MSRPNKPAYDLTDAERRDLTQLIADGRPLPTTRVDLLAFEFEMGLFPAALGEAREKGIDLTPRYIPADVFDKRAVDRGQVVFHDVSCVEATPRYAKKNKVLTKHWTDWVDYWAVDFDYTARKEIIKVPRNLGVEAHLPGMPPVQGEIAEYEERWTGGYMFENEWQSFRARQNRKLEVVTAEHLYHRAGRYTVAVKVIDIFANDTMALVPVHVG